jgi:hypothetical protein
MRLGPTGPTGPNVASPLNENLIASRHGSRENGSNAEPRPNGEKGPGQQRQLEEEGAYPYRDASGQVAFEVMRFVLKQGENYVVGKYGKRIRTSLQRRPSGEPDQSWLWGLGAGEFMRRAPGKDLGKFDATEFEQYPATRQRKIFTAAPVIPYQLPDLLKAVAAGHTICIAEDEEKVELIRGFGFPATCCAGGAKKWRPEHSVYLKGADVVLLRDNDPVEREHMELIAKSLAPIARLRILGLPNLPEKGDVLDWHEAGGSAEEFARLLAAAPDYMPNATVNISAVREFIYTIAAQAKAALNGAEVPGLLQLSRLHPDNNKLVPSRFHIDDIERMIEAAAGHSGRGYNVYIEGRLVRPGLNDNERGKLADTAAIFAYAIDSDADKQMGWTATKPVSMTVETSPGNFQYWLFLREAIFDAELGRKLGERIRAATRTDHDTGNVVQPYRVAGTINYPNRNKIARGRTTVPTRLVEFDPEVLWTPEEIEQAFPLPERKTENRERRTTNEANIPGETMRVIREGVPKDLRSDVFWNVMIVLKQDGWSIDAIVGLLERFPNGIAAKYIGRLQREVERVYNKLKDPPLDQDAPLPKEQPTSRLHWHGEVDPHDGRAWTVQDLVPEVGKGVIAGQWGTFKTFAALDLAHAIMSGEPFLDFEIVRRGGVLFLARKAQAKSPSVCRASSMTTTRSKATHHSRGLRQAPRCWQKPPAPSLASSPMKPPQSSRPTSTYRSR